MTRILIVDDHEANLYLLRSLLEGHGYTVDDAPNGAEALTVARQNPPDLILSDLLMPVMDGYTLLRRWRADEDLLAIPFVVYTATYTEPRDERLAYALGADAFIIKPAEPEALTVAVRDMLDKKARGELPSEGERPEEQAMLQEYNEVLVQKLEKRARQLEQANRELRDEVAERARSESRLRESEERYRTLFNAISDPLFVYDRDTLTFLAVNDAAVTLYGYSRDEFVAMTVQDLRPANTADDPEVPDLSRHRKKDGEPIDVAITSHDLEFAGRPAHFVQARDITDRLKLEEQLLQSQKMEAVGRLAAGVAHDFNNLLTVITGHSELMLSAPGASEGDAESLTAIREAGERASSLTRQLLGFSRQTMLQPKVLDLNAVVSETATMLRRLIGEDIHLTTALAPKLYRVKVDPGQLDQVILNLAVNARDAMPRGGSLTIETANVVLGEGDLEARPDTRPGPHAMLSVSDTGCGMTGDVLARVFEPFFTTKEVGQGTGLGLAMVYGIVKQSDGNVHVYSEPGRGTTFRIYLPAVDGHVGASGRSEDKPDLHGTETVLLVEDDDGVRGLARRCLAKYGYTVLAAADGVEALRVVREHPGTIDLVLTDVVMPNMGGPELAEKLHAALPDVKILFTSGYTDDDVVRHGLLAANVAFIQKPYRPIELAKKLRDVLDGT